MDHQATTTTTTTFPRIHLRQEQKPHEHRSFSPTAIRALVEAGYPVSVERTSPSSTSTRVFPDDEYVAAGATLVPVNSWTHAPAGTVILGLKELEPDEDFALHNDHVAYMHCFKGQDGWRRVLSRFLAGGSVLYDLEFLVDGRTGRRANAFSYWAGFCGAAMAVKDWAWGLENPGVPMVGMAAFTEGRGYYRDEAEMVAQVRHDLERGEKVAGRKPTAMIMGAMGTCGRGAKDLFFKIGLGKDHVVRWDVEQTKRRDGPYDEILEHDIFINAVYLTNPIPPFVTKESLAKRGRKLRVVVDVSCDVTSPDNPLPIYDSTTTFAKPTVFANLSYDENANPVSIISIDHLPSLLPREASEAFSNEMTEWLLQLKDRQTAQVWKGAEKVFEEKLAVLTDEMHMDVGNPKYTIGHHHGIEAH